MNAFPFSFRSLLAVSIVILFSALSFNAYACLLPAMSVPAKAMGAGCSTPEEAPVYQVCDMFKTLGVQSVDKSHFSRDGHVMCIEASASVAGRAMTPSRGSRLHDRPPDNSPQDLLLQISVLRI
ncbi:MAG: hypothetical protein RI101_06395 [Nitrospira sp.]|jgi:hypothetical protein|nr:hypothetical protein [Nitrospira sp.]